MTLGRSIVLLLSGLLLGTGIIVGGVGYIAAQSSITELRGILLEQLDERVQQRLQSYFDRAKPALGFIEYAIFDDPEFIENWEAHAPLLVNYIKTEPDIIWLYYADAETGNLLGINVDPEGRYIINRIHVDNKRLAQGFEVQPNGSLKPVESLPSNQEPYDPRNRPWFKKALEEEGTSWTAPYQFVNSEIIGITAARAVSDKSGKIKGVLAADLELSRVGAFLDSFDIAAGGSAFLLLENGEPVVPENIRQNPTVNILHQAIEAQHWDFSDVKSGKTTEREFSYDGDTFIAMIQELALPGMTRYFGAIIVPADAYLEKINRNSFITVAGCGGIFLIAIGLGVWQAKRVTTPLELLGSELEQIANLRFRESGLKIRSSIREVALFSESVGKMKISLRAFSRYVPRDLVRHLLAQGEEAKLGGVLRQVTAVFTDLAGFTSMSESLSPDEAFKELSIFLEVIADTQEKYHGITSSFTGDGTLALFNAPDELEYHAENACLAALEALTVLDSLNETRRAQGKFEFKARIGINTAEVLVGNLGTRERFAYTAIGDGVNLASRLEGLGKIYGVEILVGGDSFCYHKTNLEWRLVDSISVAGRRQSTKIYQPLGIKGDVDEATLIARDTYEAALSEYFSGRFETALSGFLNATSQWPGNTDNPTKIMIERIKTLLSRSTEAPEGWTGVFTAESK